MKQQEFEDKKVKVFYLNELQQWEIYTQATLRLKSREGGGLNLMFFLKQPLPSNKLTVLPLIQTYRDTEKAICIEMPMISQAQKLDELIFAFRLDEWNRVLSISFRDRDYCSLVLEEIQLQMSLMNQLPCQPSQFIKYISDEMVTSPGFIDWVFENQMPTQQFFSYISQNQLTEEQEKDVFKIIKCAFMRGNKEVIYTFLKDQYFIMVLRCLSMNHQFGDRKVDYVAQYLKTQRCKNIFQFEDERILNGYKDIVKSRYLIDCPTSMFIELNTQAVFQDIIRDGASMVVAFLELQPNFITQYKQSASNDPLTYVQIFSQVWEMFKLVIEDSNSWQVKTQFYQIFKRQHLLRTAFQCVFKIAQQNKADHRLYQKFIQSLNPFLSFRWNESQQFLLQQYHTKQLHLAPILISILALNDYNIKSVVLIFARFLIEPTQNRKSFKQSFYSYVFTQFVEKIQPFFVTVQELQILVLFLLKCYKADPVRTRRCIIESNLVGKLESKSNNKFIQILILKLLRALLQMTQIGIFIYLQRHSYFNCLRQGYFVAKKFTPRGVLHSMFIGLLKDCQRSNNKLGVKYVYNIMFPDEKI